MHYKRVCTIRDSHHDSLQSRCNSTATEVADRKRNINNQDQIQHDKLHVQCLSGISSISAAADQTAESRLLPPVKDATIKPLTSLSSFFTLVSS
jgi:hypothetical protein